MRHLSSFVQSLLGGLMVGVGGMVFLSVEDRVVGAALFAVGLFAICTFGLNLYTGKVCYVFDNQPPYLGFVAWVWVGNLAGACLAGTAVRLTRIAPIAQRAAALCDVKLDDTLLSTFILAVLCNIMIYLSVENFARNPHEMGKYMALLFGVMVFILAGFEHCVANMFYFTAAGAWSGKALLYLLVATAGNAVGGVIFPLAKKLKLYAERASA